MTVLLEGAKNLGSFWTSYANGPIMIGGGYEQNRRDDDIAVILGTCNFDVVKLGAGYSQVDTVAIAGPKRKNRNLMATAPVGVVTLKAGYSQSKAEGTELKTKKIGLGGEYVLSKCTHACAKALVREGAQVVIVARTEGPLREAAAEFAALGPGPVAWVAADLASADGRARIFAAHPEFDILVTNAGGPPPGDFRHWDREAWLRAIDANMLAPIELIKATVTRGAARRAPGQAPGPPLRPARRARQHLRLPVQRHAGYINGQNLLMDGGSFPGVF
ncbi:SDR family NAD(P)-dependent oxidoreductase [Ramlibacter sp. 2FC]|uniref:SDR family NAD(P)-dependent oxidoreductase n=1 Tax=Ramlibacter sp. 2FC TaxID=2502188 RepID=UPI0032E512CD